MITSTKTPRLTREPFQTLYNQGHILGPDGLKMSKSRGNVINPDSVVSEYGADCLRMYEMFLGPYGDNKPWNVNSVKGVYRFLEKVWRLIEVVAGDSNRQATQDAVKIPLNDLVQSISDKIPNLQFNTCVSDFMKFINDYGPQLSAQDLKTFLKLMFPFAPIISVEGLQRLGETTFLDDYYQGRDVWPKYDPKLSQTPIMLVKVMIHNKFRGELQVQPAESETEIINRISNLEDIAKFLPTPISKIIYVPGKVINIL